MKKDSTAAPLLPFTDDEEAALALRLTTMDGPALSHYADSARLALANKALDPSWRPRIEHGLMRAEAAIVTLAQMEPVVVEPAPVAAPKMSKAKAAAAAKAAEAAVVDSDDDEEE